MATSTFPTHPGFEQSIHDDPYDAATRLIYADWLEEHGDWVHARFQRDWVEFGREPYAIGRFDSREWVENPREDEGCYEGSFWVRKDLFERLPGGPGESRLAGTFGLIYLNCEVAENALLTAYRRLAYDDHL